MKEYSYNIINDVYNWMISRKKDIEVRILKEKSQAIQVGDIITFNNQDIVGKYVKVKITNKTIVDIIETNIIPILIIFGKIPFSFVIQVKYANIGEHKANIVPPIMKFVL